MFKRQTFEEFPFTVAGDSNSRNRMMGIRIAVACAVICLVGFLLSLADFLLPDAKFFSSADLLPVLLCAAFGTILFAGTAYVLSVVGRGKWRLFRVDKEEVVCSDGHGQELWRDAVRAYTGVRWREVRHTATPEGGGGTVQVLELMHPLGDYVVKFIETGSLNYAVKCCRAWSAALDLPVFREVAGLTTVREPQDFDRPLVALREDGREVVLEGGFDPASPLPPGVRWQQDDDRRWATVRIYHPILGAQVVGLVLLALLGLLVCGTLTAWGVLGHSPWGIVGACVLVPLLLRFFIWPLTVLTFRARRRLAVSSEGAIVTLELLGRTLRRRVIALTEITRVIMSDRGLTSLVVIEGRDARLRMGELEENVAGWLARFALAAVLDSGLAPST